VVKRYGFVELANMTQLGTEQFVLASDYDAVAARLALRESLPLAKRVVRLEAGFRQLEAERDAAVLMRKGFSKIIDEQARLLTYVYKHFPGNVLLSDGWMEDCKEILQPDGLSRLSKKSSEL
jgi:hypothetical protein